jgi:acyl-CoA hydrolase
VGNEAEVGAGFFDLLLDDAANTHTLFALPREPIGTAEFALGLHASTLVCDGGTLQIGIGALSDAIVHALLLRQRSNADYLDVLQALGGAHPLASRIGGLEPFRRGLYGASEMVMDGFMHLAGGGVLKRRVYDDFALEQALAEGVIEDELQADSADRLYACGALPARMDARELARLVRFGLLPFGTASDGDSLVLPDGSRLPADISSREARATLGRVLAGRRLREGRYLRGAFYLGTKDFYAWLRGLTGEDFEGLSMTRVSDINQLYGGRETLDALQRRDARFFNTCMMATALGAATSDALADGRVVSGVGGQYNFVSMAHALRDGRSILLLRSHRGDGEAASSNILWSYGHVTIPRHLRDVFVTEYGVADLRGRSDQDCTLAMLAITDARFIDGLVGQAQRAGKLPHDFAVPESWRRNTPQHLAAALQPWRQRGLFPALPFGSDFDADELRLLPALQWLKQASTTKRGRLHLAWRGLTTPAASTDEARLLARLGLAMPATFHERFLRRVVTVALQATRRE